MSYDLRINVKVEGLTDKYIEIAKPELDSPTYNLGKMFRECMLWNYQQCYQDANGDYQKQYYNCKDIMPKIKRGINELEKDPDVYKVFEPENGWGTLQNAIDVLKSLKECIEGISELEEIPLECLWMNW